MRRLREQRGRDWASGNSSTIWCLSQKGKASSLSTALLADVLWASQGHFYAAYLSENPSGNLHRSPCLLEHSATSAR